MGGQTETAKGLVRSCRTGRVWGRELLWKSGLAGRAKNGNLGIYSHSFSMGEKSGGCTQPAKRARCA